MGSTLRRGTRESYGFPEVADTLLPGKATKLQPVGTVPQTDTGGQDEYSEALERTRVKELGKLAP